LLIAFVWTSNQQIDSSAVEERVVGIVKRIQEKL
jgi:hypothetical protein